MTVPNIVEITNEIYQEVFRRRLSKKYVGRKVNNASMFNLRRNFHLHAHPHSFTE